MSSTADRGVGEKTHTGENISQPLKVLNPAGDWIAIEEVLGASLELKVEIENLLPTLQTVQIFVLQGCVYEFERDEKGVVQTTFQNTSNTGHTSIPIKEMRPEMVFEGLSYQREDSQVNAMIYLPALYRSKRGGILVHNQSNVYLHLHHGETNISTGRFSPGSVMFKGENPASIVGFIKQYGPRGVYLLVNSFAGLADSLAGQKLQYYPLGIVKTASNNGYNKSLKIVDGDTGKLRETLRKWPIPS